MKKPIRIESENEKALQRTYSLMQKNRRTAAKNDELELLAILVEDFEKKNYPLEAPDPIEAIKVRMEQMGMTRNDLANIIGHHSRVSEIFSGKENSPLK